MGEIGVIDRIIRCAATVVNAETSLFQILDQDLFEVITAVVGADGDGLGVSLATRHHLIHHAGHEQADLLLGRHGIASNPVDHHALQPALCGRGWGGRLGCAGIGST